MANVSRTKKSGQDGNVIAGLSSGVLKIDQLAVGGGIRTQAEVAALIQKRIDAAQRVDQAKALWKDAIKEFEAIDAQVDVVVRDLRNIVIGAFGEDGQELANFQFAPPKRAVFTQEQMAEIVRKRNETRKARRTMGRKQKKAIKGVVPVAAAPAEPVVATAGAAAVSASAPAVGEGAGASPAVLVALGGAGVPAGSGAPLHTEAATQGATADGSGSAVTSAPRASTGEPGTTSG